jgi:hypothetical protein
MLMDEHDDLQQRLRRLGNQPIEPRRQAADLVAMAAVRAPSRRRPGLLGSKVRVAAAFLAGLLVGSTGLAAADALPDPAQHVAHNVLARVGVDVPNPERYHGPECGAEVKQNHGDYVRDDHALAQSDCGKPVHAGNPSADHGNGNGAAKGPCQGRPLWAGDHDLTDAELEAAKAERLAQCGPDDDADEPEADKAEATPTTTEATTTTVAPTSTTAPTTTSTTATTTTTTTTTTPTP